MSLLGDKIKELRKEIGMTQEDITSELNVSQQAITKWENVSSLPSSGNMIKLAELFNVSIDVLVTLTVDKNLSDFDLAGVAEFIHNAQEKVRRQNDLLIHTKKIVLYLTGVLLTYELMYFICWFLNVQIGIKIHPWYYIKKYHIILLMGIPSIIAVILQKKKFTLIMLLGATLSVLVGQIIGEYSIHHSPVTFNESWLG